MIRQALKAGMACAVSKFHQALTRSSLSDLTNHPVERLEVMGEDVIGVSNR